MTPCINLIKKANIAHTLHAYESHASNVSYGLEAAQKLNVDENRVFKTLVVNLEGSRSLLGSGKDFAVGIIPVSSQLNMKRMAKVSGSKKAKMAEARDVERSTGYVLGGVSPLGQMKPLKTIIDVSAEYHPTIFVSAGRRGLEVELKPADLLELSQGIFAEIT